MTQTPSGIIDAHFGTLKDPRTGRMVHHCLIEIVTIAILEEVVAWGWPACSARRITGGCVRWATDCLRRSGLADRGNGSGGG